MKYCWIHGEKQFGFLTAFVDVYTRQIKAWGLSRSCRSEDVLRVLKLALSQIQISHREELFIRFFEIISKTQGNEPGDKGNNTLFKNLSTLISLVTKIHRHLKTFLIEW